MIVWFDLHFKVYFCPNCQIFIDEFIFCFEQSLCVRHVKITCEDSFSTERFQFSAILGQKKFPFTLVFLIQMLIYPSSFQWFAKGVSFHHFKLPVGIVIDDNTSIDDRFPFPFQRTE